MRDARLIIVDPGHQDALFGTLWGISISQPRSPSHGEVLKYSPGQRKPR